MLKRIVDIFTQKLPQQTVRSQFFEALFLGLFVGAFIYVFQPFGTYEDNFLYKDQLLLGYGVVVFIAYFPLKTGFLFLQKEDSPTLLRETLNLSLIFFLISIVCFIYFIAFISPDTAWTHFTDFIIFSFAIGILPLMLILFWRYFDAEQKALLEKSKSVTQKTEEKTIEIHGQNRGETYRFLEFDLIYFQSSGNYVEVFFTKDSEIRSVLIRSTLALISKQLPGENFINVHRSYLINRPHFSRLKKDQGKGSLISENLGVEVPVSRGNLNVAEQIVKDFR
ncbi:LytR/AlgR family response regulator transcription factor [Algoriphagus sediminis]|uniref:LytTR family DNA-binding domain-containing protein n=1 Tax=Algoriphagus sediminis TaxID=3057113 RepID=A0ABT7YA04_9BACT|nr:LytTR family DNA-binding domain-containing protein [Algoriphagus sediminis]MDN3203347.1 LytTR family DNA-binding domain-containing protein [Algoriphagus sediminis]